MVFRLSTLIRITCCLSISTKTYTQTDNLRGVFQTKIIEIFQT